ncbi:MAG: signal peptidase II [Chitinophagaceae bacterium]|nr:signal peptidase II [Anaerolineae bacterium]
MGKQTKRWILLLAVVVAVLAVDQLSKRLVIESMELTESIAPIPALGNVFRITRSLNTGAAFGFLENANDLFLIVALVVVGAMLLFYPRIPDEARLVRVAIGLVCGGALGNALDRVQYEHVVDFIHYRIPGVIDNVSNLADHAIVLGVLLILYDNWRGERRKKQASTETVPSSETASTGMMIDPPDSSLP